MNLKKSMLLGTALALVNLPMLAHADLKTDNHSKIRPSTVGIIKPTGITCVGPLGYYTEPDHHSEFSRVLVNALCGSDPCNAYVYMDKTCTSAPIAQATFSLADQKITAITPMSDTYKVTGVNTDTATIDGP